MNQLGAFFDTPSDAEASDHATAGCDGQRDAFGNFARRRPAAHARRSCCTTPRCGGARRSFSRRSATPLDAVTPARFGHMLGAADMAVNGAVEVAIAGVPAEKDASRLCEHEVVDALHSVACPRSRRREHERHRTDGRSDTRRGKATAYVCRSYACDEPATTPQLFVVAARDCR